MSQHFSGSRIVIHGMFAQYAPFNIYIKSDKGADTMQIAGLLGGSSDFGFHPGKTTISGYTKSVVCWNYTFYNGKTVVIVIEVKEHGIKYYGDGELVCTFENDTFKRNDISQIDVSGSLEVLGYGSNTCDYYRY
ncbi:hypothetical protein AB6A40_010511 [Gnathostoma spinigerum]|uniref:Galectin n=1 Tax=Gnathostoma spinigerum TaxID=75299 RepID=A0ABD6EXH2_9BILA